MVEKHYTLLKAAELLGVTTQTLRNWDNSGKICAIRTPGNQRRIPESEISRLLNYPANNAMDTKQAPQQSTDDERTITDKATEKSKAFQEAADKLPKIVPDKEENHILMCKDVEVYDIARNKIISESLVPGCILRKTMDYPQWMKTRYSTDTNFSAVRLMQRAFGSYNHEHAAVITRALSLSDNYWLKKQNEDVRYESITPYIHKEWDAVDGYTGGSLSNLFINGKNDKRWLTAQTLLKQNSSKEIEPYSLCAAMGLTHTVKTQAMGDGIILNNFTSTSLFYESMQQSGFAEKNADPREIAVENFGELAVALFVIDYLVENTDRHPGNYGFLRDSNTGEYISMAPYYDFDWAWSGNVTALPDNAWQEYSDYIHGLCRHAISVAADFEYGSVIESRAGEMLWKQ